MSVAIVRSGFHPGQWVRIAAAHPDVPDGISPAIVLLFGSMMNWPVRELELNVDAIAKRLVVGVEVVHDVAELLTVLGLLEDSGEHVHGRSVLWPILPEHYLKSRYDRVVRQQGGSS